METPATAHVGVTMLLNRARENPHDQKVWDELYKAVENELRKVAAACLRRQGPGDHTLQATVLINEAVVRLVSEPGNSFQNSKHFYKVASGVMRRILVDHARRQRPGHIEGDQLANMGRADEPAPGDRLQRAERLVKLDGALSRLWKLDPEAAQLFELHVFGAARLSLGATPEEWIIEVPDKGLPVEEVAAMLGIKRATAYRLRGRARDFLQRELQDEAV